MKRKTYLLFFLIFPFAVRADTALIELIQEAVRVHPSVLSSRATFKSAEAGVDSAKWQFFPTPSMSVKMVDASNKDPSYQGDDYVATASLTQPLWSGGRIRAGYHKAKAGLGVADAGLEEARQRIALRVVQGYGDWLSAYLKGLAWQTSLETHERLRDQVRRRVKEGVSTQSDMSLAKGRLASSQSDFTATRAQETVARSRLALLLNRSVSIDELSGLQVSPRRVNDALDALHTQASDISPAINRAISQMKVATAEMKEIKAERWPELYFRAEYEEGSFTFNDTDPQTRFSIGINSRFGAGLSSLTRVNESRYRREAAQAEIENQRRILQEQISVDYALVTAFEQRVQTLRIALKTSQEVLGSYRRQFLSGRKSWLDVMNAARDLVGTQVQLADAEASWMATSWRLTVITQGVWAL